VPVKLQQLHYFVAVADAGQMTRAAKSLHLAQPALSQAIAQMESQLGLELLERHARGVSLTSAGATYCAKARIVLAAAADAEMTALALTRDARHVVEVGFVGSPPMLDAPELFAAFAAKHPDIELAYRELPFPPLSTAAWLAEVDLALCFSPTAHEDLRIQPLRVEPRVVVAAQSHPLAQRRSLMVSDVLDETFPGNHPSVDPVWAGLWHLDDHRGEPAPHVTTDHATNPNETAAIVASGRAAAVTAASNATNIVRALRNLVAIPLSDADPVELSLVWHRDNPNRFIEAVLATARSLPQAATA
jgi:DNA-binding transcriptional LysR family regulator